MWQYILAHKMQVGFISYVTYSVFVSPLPEDLRHFDWHIYIPAVLKGLSATFKATYPKAQIQEKP